MGFKTILRQSTISNYGKAIRTAPREVIFNRPLIFSVMLYAMSAIPASKSSSTSTMNSS